MELSEAKANHRTNESASAAAWVFLLFAPSLSPAHHSYAMFDNSKSVTVSGMVARFEWTNPHTFIWVYVPSKQNPGKYDLYAFENNSPNLLQHTGWTSRTLQPGDKVTIEFLPLRDGRKGGHVSAVTLADGRKLRS